jgi:hypothetical protein
MDKVELKRKLDDVGIRPEDYSLDGILKPMATVLKLLNSKWCTFDYDERGRVQDERIFDTEDQACQDILNRMIELKRFREKFNLK